MSGAEATRRDSANVRRRFQKRDETRDREIANKPNGFHAKKRRTDDEHETIDAERGGFFLRFDRVENNGG